MWRRLDAGHLGTGHPDAGALDAGAHLGAAVPTTGGGMVLCLPDRLVLLNTDGSRHRLASYPTSPTAHPATRSNDAKADPAGRLWHGTMAYDLTPAAAALYRLAQQAGEPELVLGALTISNGIGWSPNGATMYHIDSPTGRVDMFDFDLETGTPSRRRPFAVVTDGTDPDHVPDGLCVDAEGGVWVAVWGGAEVRRYTADGVLERRVALPTPRVSSCAFVGPDLDLLVITTASDGRPHDPAAGRTYLYRPNVTGLPCDRYATDITL
jgi:sugar lactone lactonase YvrE